MLKFVLLLVSVSCVAYGQTVANPNVAAGCSPTYTYRAGDYPYIAAVACGTDLNTLQNNNPGFDVYGNCHENNVVCCNAPAGGAPNATSTAAPTTTTTTTAKPTTAANKNPNACSGLSYTVRAGDYPYLVAVACGTDLNTLQNNNPGFDVYSNCQAPNVFCCGAPYGTNPPTTTTTAAPTTTTTTAKTTTAAPTTTAAKTTTAAPTTTTTTAKTTATTAAPTTTTTAGPTTTTGGQCNSVNDDIVARTILGEGFEQGTAGYQAIAWVLYNRYKTAGFPKTSIVDVCQQPGQFEVWFAGNPANSITQKPAQAQAHKDYPTCLALAHAMNCGGTPTASDPTNGACFFVQDSPANEQAHPGQVIAGNLFFQHW